TKYGVMVGERPVIRSTATLACIGRRQNEFREECLAALEILANGDVRPAELKGSWAGAFGPTQFMPTSFKRYAVDFDGDGRRDAVSTWASRTASSAEGRGPRCDSSRHRSVRSLTALPPRRSFPGCAADREERLASPRVLSEIGCVRRRQRSVRAEEELILCADGFWPVAEEAPKIGRASCRERV